MQATTRLQLTWVLKPNAAFSDSDSNSDFGDCVALETAIFDTAFYTWACSAEANATTPVWDSEEAFTALDKQPGVLDVVDMFGGLLNGITKGLHPQALAHRHQLGSELRPRPCQAQCCLSLSRLHS